MSSTSYQVQINCKSVLRLLILWFVTGALYFSLEGIWRIPQGGYANIAMLPVGGLCGAAVGGINQLPRFYKLKVYQQAIIGTLITLSVEFAAGCLLNLRLGLELWDYSGLPGNLLGQVCPQFALLWLLLMPFAIWLEDTLRWGFWREGKPYSLGNIYTDFLLLR